MMKFVIQRRWNHRYMKDIMVWRLDREDAFEFRDQRAALQFCTEHNLSGMDILQRDGDAENDVMVQTIWK